MPEQLSLLPIADTNYVDPADRILTPDEVKAKLKETKEAKSRLAGNNSSPSNLDYEIPTGWGPDEYRSMGPGWVEDSGGDVLPPSDGESFDTNPTEYYRHCEEVRRAAVGRAEIAACRETLEAAA